VRVAIRRLRSWIRAYRPYVDDTLKKKTRRRLRDLARVTSGARDAEVAAAWVRAHSDVPVRARSGFRDVAERLESERDAGLREIKSQFARDLPGALSALRKQLAEYFDQQTVGEPVVVESMSAAAAAATVRQATRVARALGRIKDDTDVDAAHRARIAAKRLRYLIEPMYERGHAPASVAQLKALQDQLGDARDMHLFAQRLVREIGEMAARDARKRALASIGVARGKRAKRTYSRVRPGMVELAQRAHQRELESVAAFRRQWTPDAVTALLDAIPRDVSAYGA
jgi:CHAD domain-containing protein